jgi:Cdc6-like AAA superfamily ATPase
MGSRTAVRERVRRRLTGGARPLVVDRNAISPVAHLADPVGRGPTAERLLDRLAPAFEGTPPDHVYCWGPRGAGKSAVVTALFDALAEQTGADGGVGVVGSATRRGSTIQTTTRSRPDVPSTFAYVDTRVAHSEFAFYRDLLREVGDRPVPEQGVGTDELVSRLRAHLDPTRRQAVVAIDHVGEPDTPSLATVRERLDPVGGAVRVVAVGRDPPAEVSAVPPRTVRVPPYDHHAMVDIVTVRTDRGLGGRALSHEDAVRIVRAADGDAGDALAICLGAAARASVGGADHLRSRDVEAAAEATPTPGVSLARVLALPESRQRVLHELVALDRTPDSVGETADLLATALSLSAGTVRRFLYELAEADVLDLVRVDPPGDGRARGRPPSRVEPRFAVEPFRRLSTVD